MIGVVIAAKAQDKPDSAGVSPAKKSVTSMTDEPLLAPKAAIGNDARIGAKLFWLTDFAIGVSSSAYESTLMLFSNMLLSRFSQRTIRSLTTLPALWSNELERASARNHCFGRLK